MDETARTTEPETTLFLLTSAMDLHLRPWGVFSTPDLAKEFAQDSEEEDARDDEDGTTVDDFELEWEEFETANGELGWKTPFDDTYSGATWMVHPLYLDPAYAQLATP